MEIAGLTINSNGIQQSTFTSGDITVYNGAIIQGNNADPALTVSGNVYFEGDTGIGAAPVTAAKLYVVEDNGSDWAGSFINSDETTGWGVKISAGHDSRSILALRAHNEDEKFTFTADGYAGFTEIGTRINEFSTDGTLAGNSDDAIPTEQAVKTYVDGATEAGGTKTSYVISGDATQSLGSESGMYEILDYDDPKIYAQILYTSGDVDPHIIVPDPSVPIWDTQDNSGTINIYVTGGELIVQNKYVAADSSQTFSVFSKR